MQPFVEPKGFSFDIIMPNNSVLGISPLNDHNDDDGSDMERETESTTHTFASKENTVVVPKKKEVVVHGIVVDNYMFSDNLNECVDFLLRKHKIQTLNIKAVIRHNSSANSKEKRKRTRKNKDQHLILLH